MNNLRFGVVGCGEISAVTCLGLSASPFTSIAMLMDTRPETLADLAELYQVPTTTNFEDVLRNPDVDAVYIATPHNLHVPLGIRAAQAGKHVLVEKPIATTLEDANKLIAACESAGVKLGVAYYAQVDDGHIMARELIRAGILGDIISIRLTSISDKPDYYWQGGYTRRVKTDWRTSKAQAGGGVMLMNISHDLNSVRFVTGLEVARVFAESDTLATDIEVEDTIAAVLRYQNGAIGVIQAGSALRGGDYQTKDGPRIYGTKGQIILNTSGRIMKPSIYLTEAAEGSNPGQWRELEFIGKSADRQSIVEGFAKAVLVNEQPPTTGQDGRRVLEIVLACYRSAQEGQIVTLPLA
ncbi:MAG: Gfo/Idh/MocA family protein [Anaerolineae bacterium]